MGFAGNGGTQIVGRGANRLAGRRVADFLEIFEMAVSVTGLALGGRTEHGRHVVVAFDVGLLGEVEVAPVRLAFAGEGGLQIFLGFGAFQSWHSSLHAARGGRPPRTGLPMPTGYCIGRLGVRVNLFRIIPKRMG